MFINKPADKESKFSYQHHLAALDLESNGPCATNFHSQGESGASKGVVTSFKSDVFLRILRIHTVTVIVSHLAIIIGVSSHLYRPQQFISHPMHPAHYLHSVSSESEGYSPSASSTRTHHNHYPEGTHPLGNWSGKRDSNSRLPPWQGGALPTELFPGIQLRPVIAAKLFRGLSLNALFDDI